MITEQYKKAMLYRLTPPPRKIEFAEGRCILQNGLRIEVRTNLPLAEKENAAVHATVSDFPDFKPELVFETDPALKDFGPEKYAVKVTENGIRISSRKYTGVKYAFYTLHQLAEPVRGTMRLTHEMLPFCEIEDEPAIAFRAIHLCIFPETGIKTVLKNLRLAAYHKFNYAVIESWGVFPYKSHPEFAWNGMKLKEEDFLELRRTAEECGIKIIPQFNIFGHASQARVISAKHCILDENPELAPLFEPSGWSFCLSNPNTRKVLTDLVTELYEFYGRPEFFHIGCDEAYDFQTCSECASADGTKLITDHIVYFHDLFAKHGTRIIMWHDMLIDKGDARWKNCIAIGNAQSAEMPDLLPRDIIIADWQYGEAPKDNPDGEWPTSLYFQEKGFEVVVCPWQNGKGMGQLCRMASKHKMFGVMETTWHTAHKAEHFAMFMDAAVYAWLGEEPEVFPLDVFACARDLRKVCRKIGISDYEDFGNLHNQVEV